MADDPDFDLDVDPLDEDDGPGTDLALPGRTDAKELTPDRDPWEKQPWESFKAFAAFALYRDLGVTRSLVKVAEAVGKNVTLIGRWSKLYRWVERAERYDVYLDRRRREQAEDERERARRRHQGLGAAMQTVAIQRLRGDENASIAGLDVNTLDPAAVARFAEVGVKLERLALGEATDLVRGVVTNVPAAEFVRITGRIVDLALDLLPDDRRDAFILGVQALAQGRS